MPSTVIVFDADNTLWDTNALYMAAAKQAQDVVERSGLSVVDFKRLQRGIDRDITPTFQLGKDQFPTSLVAAYDSLMFSSGRAHESLSSPLATRSANDFAGFDLRNRLQLWNVGMDVFTEPAPLFDGVNEMLAEMAALAPLALITKGNAEVQRARIEHSGLGEYFSYVGVVERSEKIYADFQSALDALGGTAEAAWSIGDSVPSDIVPAEQMGFRTVLFSNPTWLLEHSDEVPDSTVTVTNITDATAVVRRALQLRSDVARIASSDGTDVSADLDL